MGEILLFVGALLLTGALAGLLAGLLGVGGGIVIVPVLYLLSPQIGIHHSVAMHVAVATSLATIIPTSLASARAHLHHGNLEINLLRMIAPSVVIGAGVGSIIGSFVDGVILTLFYALLAGGIGVSMLLRNGAAAHPRQLPDASFLRRVAGFPIGLFSAMMGIGGGTFAVPFFTMCRLNIKKAVGTSSAVGTLIALPATLGFIVTGWQIDQLPPFSLGYVSLPGFCILVVSTICTAPLGAKLANVMDSGRLQKLFGLFLLITAMKVISTVL